MKLSFNLLLLDAPHQAVNRACEKLSSVCAELPVPQLSIDQLLAMDDTKLSAQVVFIAGSTTTEELYRTCHALMARDAVPIIVRDAISTSEPAQATLVKLSEERVQYCAAAQVKALVRCTRPMLYTFPKADNTATLLIVVDAGTRSARVLTIVRGLDPFKGMESLPGGFIDPHLESLPECGAREGAEETHVVIRPEDLVFLDLRSSPHRDERGHVVDHGFMWLVPSHLKARVLASVQAGDDAVAGSASFRLVTELLARGSMAFDHFDLLLAGVRTHRVLPPAGLLLRGVRFLERCLGALAHRLEQSDKVFRVYHN